MQRERYKKRAKCIVEWAIDDAAHFWWNQHIPTICCLACKYRGRWERVGEWDNGRGGSKKGVKEEN